MKYSRILLTVLLIPICWYAAIAQNPGNDKLKVFVDCSNTWCEMEYFRSKINLIHFYRDPIQSDVHVLITSNRNASGGRLYQMIFYGLNKYAGTTDTLVYNTHPNATDYERRDLMLNQLKLGLVPWVAKTDWADKLLIDMYSTTEEESVVAEGPLMDKWNYWVFRLSADGSYDADAVYEDMEVQARVTVSRITQANKFYLSYRNEQNFRSYEFEDDNGVSQNVVVQNYSQSLFHQYVKSLSDHWSVGYEVSYRGDTFSNYKMRLVGSPALEYSIFPYDEFNTKFFTIKYSAGLYAANYRETTIYELTNEVRPRHEIQLTTDFNQKWGNLGIGTRFLQYLHDPKIYNLGVEADIELRITGGLSVDLRAYASLVHDQLNLPVGEASEEEVLTQRRLLQTNFDAGVRFGISYRFGSNLNNFVNPRFDDN